MKRRREGKSHEDEDVVDGRRSRKHVARAMRRRLVARAGTAYVEAEGGRPRTEICHAAGSSGASLDDSTVGRLERGWDPGTRYLSFALGSHDVRLCGRNFAPLRPPKLLRRPVDLPSSLHAIHPATRPLFHRHVRAPCHVQAAFARPDGLRNVPWTALGPHGPSVFSVLARRAPSLAPRRVFGRVYRPRVGRTTCGTRWNGTMATAGAHARLQQQLEEKISAFRGVQKGERKDEKRWSRWRQKRTRWKGR